MWKTISVFENRNILFLLTKNWNVLKLWTDCVRFNWLNRVSDLVAPLRATTRAAGFFFVLQYIPASDEGSLDEEEEEEENFYEEAHREGDDE